MQYEIVLKVMGVVHVILAFLKLFLLLNYSKEGGCSGYWCSSGSSTSTHEHMAKNKAII